MIVLILLVLAMVFALVGFFASDRPWHGIALVLTILALLLPHLGAA